MNLLQTHTMDNLVYRQFATDDEDAVRRICFETAFDEVTRSNLANDTWLVTEGLIGCHMRYEPGHFWIAEGGGVVAGYLAGVENTRLFEKTYAINVIPRLLLRWVLRARFLRSRGWTLMLSSFRYASAWRAPKRNVAAEYPAHLHINMASGYRGHGTGTELVRRFLTQLRERQVTGVHATTHSEQARHFFERTGFDVFASVSLPTPFSDSHTTGWMMVKSLGGPGA